MGFVKISGEQLIFDKWIYLNDEVLLAFKIKHEGHQVTHKVTKERNQYYRSRHYIIFFPLSAFVKTFATLCI
jgi:hypothetical protein